MTTVSTSSASQLVETITDVLGPDAVVADGKKIKRYLRDFSWYSPILDNALSDTTVDAVIKPTTVEELTTVVALAAKSKTPITLRGAGTGNYGQSLPLRQGLVIDIKGVAGILEVSDGRITVLPGTIMKTLEEAANETGQELAVMPSTYRVATASGFICGGSGGLGAAQNGDLWSDNILAVEMITVEEEPRTIRLEGHDVFPVLHTYGTIGVITKIEMRLLPVRTYDSVIVTFSDFADTARFGWDLVNSPVVLRLSSIHQAPIGAMFTPIAESYGAADHVALVWFDSADRSTLEKLAQGHNGVVKEWPEDATHISQFPYSHTILWSKRAHPDSSWLQCEYAFDDRDRIVEQIALITARYPAVFMQHIEFNIAPGGQVRTKGIPSIVGLENYTDALDEMIAFCLSIGVEVHNPHSFVVEEGGFVGDTARMLELKRSCDPLGILNPGKLGTSFFVGRNDAESVEKDFASPEQLENIADVTRA